MAFLDLNRIIADRRIATGLAHLGNPPFAAGWLRMSRVIGVFVVLIAFWYFNRNRGSAKKK